MKISNTLRNIVQWHDGQEEKNAAIAKFVAEKFKIEGFESLTQIHLDQNGEWTPAPEDGWPTAKKDMEKALSDQKEVVYKAVWEAIEQDNLSVESSSNEPAPMPDREDAINPIDMMEDETEDETSDEELAESVDENADSTDKRDADSSLGTELDTDVDTDGPRVTEHVVEETASFLDVDENAVVAKPKTKKKTGGTIEDIIRGIVRDEIRNNPNVGGLDEDQIKKLIKKTLKEAF